MTTNDLLETITVKDMTKPMYFIDATLGKNPLVFSKITKDAIILTNVEDADPDVPGDIMVHFDDVSDYDLPLIYEPYGGNRLPLKYTKKHYSEVHFVPDFKVSVPTTFI